MLARVQGAHKTLLSVFVFDIALTFTLSNDIEVIRRLTLLDLDLLRLTHNQLNLGNDVVLDL